MATRSTTNTKRKFAQVPEDVDLNMFIPVINGFHGMLVYVSTKTHEEYIWERFGDIQYLELKELRGAKSTNKDMYINNYFMFDDEFSWVIPYLGLEPYYENAVDVDGMTAMFSKSPTEVKKCIKDMSKGQKKSLSYYAREKVHNGEIDSLKLIKALEESLGITLIETE